jgi:hypothetical protein
MWASGSVGTPHLHDCGVHRSAEQRICTYGWFLRTGKPHLYRSGAYEPDVARRRLAPVATGDRFSSRSASCS